jgi:hypothetical protein
MTAQMEDAPAPRRAALEDAGNVARWDGRTFARSARSDPPRSLQPAVENRDREARGGGADRGDQEGRDAEQSEGDQRASERDQDGGVETVFAVSIVHRPRPRNYS